MTQTFNFVIPTGRYPFIAIVAILIILGAPIGCHRTQKSLTTIDPIQGAKEALQKCASAENLAEVADVMTNESAAALGCNFVPVIAWCANPSIFAKSLNTSPKVKDSLIKLKRDYDLPSFEPYLFVELFRALFSTMATSISGKHEVKLSPEERSKLEKELVVQCDSWKAQCKKLIPRGRNFLQDLHSFIVLLQREGAECSFTIEEQFKQIDIAKLNFTDLSPVRIKISGPGLRLSTWEARLEEGEWRIHFMDCNAMICFGR